ncbi:NAD(P)/FAD-dependent oxidoreductase [Methyloligella halotolerans]|uniref:NAD(P)/FAD-dependent oxidoreductase n=1 Tax=Methyloligella halotolerans TaxID=1177755 RepID=UPI00083D6A2B|nr:FAD-dependent oxidoreductase [Methyloligella halotolerans]
MGQDTSEAPLDIGVVGTGISGLAAAWLLSSRHRVTLYDSDVRPGGHSHTVSVTHDDTDTPVDTGFIVYNQDTYPNLTALFALLNIETQPTEMSFSVSLDRGELEYSGSGLGGLFAQRRNLVDMRFWAMLRDLRRFYRTAPRDLPWLPLDMTLGDYLDRGGYGDAFRDDHLIPMGSAIWSASGGSMADYPAAAFIRFFDNHGLLRFRDRPEWRSVSGGSRTYVEKLIAETKATMRLGEAIGDIDTDGDRVRLRDASGAVAEHDHVVIATHADQALAMLARPTEEERRRLCAFRYSRNETILHSDPQAMPKRHSAWAAWNHIGTRDASDEAPTMVTYWMNRLQGLQTRQPFFVSLNPERMPDRIWHRQIYEHPIFDTAALESQRGLWSLQGRRRLWFCGAYFGAGFHEDGLQAGLAVAEQLGGMRRPWQVAAESGRIFFPEAPPDTATEELAA